MMVGEFSTTEFCKYSGSVKREKNEAKKKKKTTKNQEMTHLLSTCGLWFCGRGSHVGPLAIEREAKKQTD